MQLPLSNLLSTLAQTDVTLHRFGPAVGGIIATYPTRTGAGIRGAAAGYDPDAGVAIKTVRVAITPPTLYRTPHPRGGRDHDHDHDHDPRRDH